MSCQWGFLKKSIVKTVQLIKTRRSEKFELSEKSISVPQDFN